MLATKRTLIGAGAALLLAGGAAGAATAQPTEAAHLQAARSVHGSSKANASYGYAHATWKWTGRGSTGRVTIYVNDQSCRDGDDTFAFMQFKLQSPTGGTYIVNGDSRAWDPNSRCHKKGLTKKYSGFKANHTVIAAKVLVCKNDSVGTGDTCKSGNWHRNPKG